MRFPPTRKFRCSARLICPAGGNQRGMALLITLTVITVLITGALELNRRVRAAVIQTASARDRHTLTQMTAAGVHAAMAMLIKDKNESKIDSIQEDWADPSEIAELLGELTFNSGKVTFSIQDEMGKIQVNALVDFPRGGHYSEPQKIMWDRFIPLLLEQDDAFEDIEATGIVNSVKDWLDTGDDDATTGLNGAEADYYETLDPPYQPANGPFRRLEELLRVKDITPELFQGLGTLGGIESFMTVYGMEKKTPAVDSRAFRFGGRININTADLPVLAAMIPSENPEYAQSIFNYRNEKEDGEFINTGLNRPTWYKDASDIPEDLTIDPRLITVSSDYFRIHAAASLNDMEMKVSVVVHREQAKKTGKWTCRILDWQAE